MAEWTLPLPSDNWVNQSQSSYGAGWNFGTNRPEVDAELGAPRFIWVLTRGGSETGENRFVAFFTSSQSGQILFNRDLSDLFEQQGSVVITVGTLSLRVDMAGMDMSSPYAFIPPNRQELIDFYDAVEALPEAQRTGTALFRDFAPVAFSDPTGDDINLLIGTATADVVVPLAFGTPSPTYSVIGTLPAGFTFTPATRALSFDENALEPGSGTITIRATNSNESADWTVNYFVTGYYGAFGDTKLVGGAIGATKLSGSVGAFGADKLR